MPSFPAKKSEVTAKVETTIAEHGQAMDALEAKIASVVQVQTAQAEAILKHDAAIAANEARVIDQAAKSVLRRVWHWLTHYEGII
jgi:hypothetical protein